MSIPLLYLMKTKYKVQILSFKWNIIFNLKHEISNMGGEIRLEINHYFNYFEEPIFL